MIELIYFLLIGIAAGWLASQIMKAPNYGLLGSLAVGVVGAVIGGFINEIVVWVARSLLGRLACATIGAILFLSLLRKFKR